MPIDHKTFLSMLNINGCLDDPPNSASTRTVTDVPLGITEMSTTEDTDRRGFYLEVSQQYGWPSCVANAVADLWEATHVHKLSTQQHVPLEQAKRATPNVSRMFLWWNARNEMEPNRSKDPAAGCYNRLALDVLSRHGVPTEALWPYDNAICNGNNEPRSVVRPSLRAYRDAFQRRTTGYYSIPEEGSKRVDRFIQTLQVLPGVLFATDVVQGLYDIGDRVATPPAETGGGHAMVAVGYNSAKNAFLVRNSWGTGCGMGGYFWMSAEYIAWKRTRACWAVTL